MQQDYTLSYLTLLTPTPADMVIGAARAGLRHVGNQLINVSKEEHTHDFGIDKPRMRETKARSAATGAELLDVQLFQVDAEAKRKSGFRSRAAETLQKRILSVRVSKLPAPSSAYARET